VFDIGFWELIFIAIIALLVLGPEKLPGAIRSISELISSVKQTANAVKSELNHELRVEELHKQLKEAEAKGLQNLNDKESSALSELQKAADSVTQPFKTEASDNGDSKSDDNTAASIQFDGDKKN
jgi:sec-independent protein translocase protein TatB